MPKAMWSQRNNNNYEQTGLLTSLHYFTKEKELFLKNFYLKAKRSISKPDREGPAAYVFPADDSRPGAQAALLEVLRKQGCEISRSTTAFTVKLPAKKPAKPAGASDKGSNPGEAPPSAEQPKEAAPTATPVPEVATKEPVSKEPGAKDAGSKDTSSKDAGAKDKAKPQPTTVQVPSGSYIVRMDQPYSRVADALLDHQYWSPNDPQKTPYDDTGWTFGELFNVRVLRVIDAKVLETPMERVSAVKVHGGISGGSSTFVINANADTALGHSSLPPERGIDRSR